MEINIVISGWVELAIDGQQQRVSAGGFYVIYPQVIVTDVRTGADTQVIVVRAPSHPSDKVRI